VSRFLKLKTSLVAFSLFVFASHVFGTDVTTVYFVPFEIETYVPITRATIISEAWEKWTISSKSKTSSLIALLNHGDEEAFDENRVRGLILSGNQTFFVDTNGVASTTGKLGIRIDKAMFLKFRDSLHTDQRQILHKNTGRQ
jgi:hypothetical protein